eukprot:TRINITY_DN1038_c0_g1_i6.p1 TRINITY_DN1038_c0_g1~~TRINITY_DN1038_c0_g1_i6.p1  ORF type:complete len:1264 (-),score=209.15 TRINITY_DN1038_c0_g1_i6:817-4608(-)
MEESGESHPTPLTSSATAMASKDYWKVLQWSTKLSNHISKFIKHDENQSLQRDEVYEWVVVMKMRQGPFTVEDSVLTYFQSRFKSFGLKFDTYKDESAGKIFMLVSANDAEFYPQKAESMQMLKTNRAGWLVPFEKAKKKEFTDSDNINSIFSSHERQSMIYHTLMSIQVREVDVNAIRSLSMGVGQPVFRILMNKRIVRDMYCLHEDVSLERIRFDWLKKSSTELIQPIRNYFGNDVGFYFAWLDFYNTLLIVPAIYGAITYFQTWNHLYSNFLVVYPLVIAVWGTLFIELWKRRSALYSYRWGLLSHSNVSPKPQVQVNENIGSSDNETNFWRLATSYSAVLLMICAPILTAMLRIYLSTQWVKNRTDGVIVSILHTMLIALQSQVYKHFCVQLNTYERHLDDYSYRKHMIIKLVMFEIPNQFLFFLYTAFYCKDMSALRSQLVIFFMVNQVQGSVTEYLIPYLSNKWNSWKTNQSTKNDAQEQLPETRGKSYSTSTNLSAASVSKIIKNQNLHNYDSTYMDYFEIAVQYALLSSFSSAAPIIPLFSYLNNIIEWNGDLYKLLYIHKRPRPEQANGIGVWLQVLEIFSVLSIVINTGLAYVYATTVIPPNDEWDPTTYVVVVVAVEHVILGLKAVAAFSIQDVPKWISRALSTERQAILSNRVNSTMKRSKVQSRDTLEDQVIKSISQLHILNISKLDRIHLLLCMMFCYAFGLYGFSIVFAALAFLFYRERQMRWRNKLVRSAISEIQAKSYLDPGSFNSLEGTEWLNYIIHGVWTNYCGELEAWLKNFINYYLDCYRPSVLSCLELRECDLGKDVPIINHISITKPTKDSSVCLLVDIDMKTKWDLVIVAGFGVDMEIKVSNICFGGKMRLSLKFVDESPYVGLIGIQFDEQPEISYQLTPLNTTDIMDIDFVAQSIQQTVQDLVKSYLVDHSIKIPLALSEIQQSGYKLLLTVVGAENLPFVELGASLDPYCKVIIGTTERKTKVLRATSSPKWEQSFTQDVTLWDDEVYEELEIQIYDAKIAKDTSLGKVKVSFKKLKPQQMNSMVFDIQDSYSGVLRLRATLLPPLVQDTSVALKIFIASFDDISPIPNKSVSIVFSMNSQTVSTTPIRLRRQNALDSIYLLMFDKKCDKLGIELFEDGEPDAIDHASISISSITSGHSTPANVYFSDRISGALRLSLMYVGYKDIPINPTGGSLTVFIKGFNNLTMPVSVEAISNTFKAIKRVMTRKTNVCALSLQPYHVCYLCAHMVYYCTVQI